MSRFCPEGVRPKSLKLPEKFPIVGRKVRRCFSENKQCSVKSYADKIILIEIHDLMPGFLIHTAIPMSCSRFLPLVQSGTRITA